MTPHARHDVTTIDLHPAAGEPAVLTLDPEALDVYRGGRSRIEPGDTVLLFEAITQDAAKFELEPTPMTVALVLDQEFVDAYRAGRP